MPDEKTVITANDTAFSVRVDGVLFGSLQLLDCQERAAQVEQRVVHWYRSERIRRASREV